VQKSLKKLTLWEIFVRSKVITALGTLALSVSANAVTNQYSRDLREITGDLVTIPHQSLSTNVTELDKIEKGIVVANASASTTCCASGTCDIWQDWDDVFCTPQNVAYIGACP
jgi:hypothetical protein